MILVSPDGSAPTAMGSFSKLYSDSGELYAYDGNGNSTVISPHNFTLRPASEPMAWSFYSKNVVKGQQVHVDMMRLARLIEEISGEKLVYLADLDGRLLNWEVSEGELLHLKTENERLRAENKKLKERVDRIEQLMGID